MVLELNARAGSDRELVALGLAIEKQLGPLPRPGGNGTLLGLAQHAERGRTERRGKLRRSRCVLVIAFEPESDPVAALPRVRDASWAAWDGERAGLTHAVLASLAPATDRCAARSTGTEHALGRADRSST